MKAIVIKRRLIPDEQSAVLDMAEKGAAVYSSISLPSEIEKNCKGNFGITEQIKRQINYDTMDFVVSFGDKEIDTRTVVDWLKFDNSSLWYYHKFRAYFRLRNLKYEIAELQRLAKEYEEVICYSNDQLLSKSGLPGNVTVSGAGTASGKNYISLIKYLMILKSRWLVNLFSFGKLKGPEHIMLDVTKRQSFLDANSLKEKKGNYVLGYLLEQLGKDFLIIDEAVSPKMTGESKISLSHDNLFGKGSLKGRYFGEPFLLNYFLSPGLCRRKGKLLSEINKNLHHLHDLSSGDEQLLLDIYLSFSSATNYYLIKYLAYGSFFKKHYFKTISTVDENSPAIRSILDAARSRGIKTIGIQHGNIHDLHPAYMYTPSDIKRHAIPDFSLVWGPYWKEFLLNKGNYTEDSLKVIGQIRTDIILKLKQSNISKENIIPGLKPDDKLIVFASQPQRDPQLRRRAAEDAMKAVKYTPNAYLFIKLHPNEKNDVGYYAAIANEIGLEKIKISLSVDLYLLISVCDILITCFSTVGTETVYFGKPLIILDHLKQDIQNYHKEGIAFQAENDQELITHIDNILSGKAGLDKEAYDRFISKYAFAIDGKASGRALSVIRRVGDQENG